MAIFSDGALVHTAVLPLGGNHLTNDIAVGLRTPLEAAEGLKRKSGCAVPECVAMGETIEVPSVGGRQARTISRKVLVKIIQPRLEEMFEHIRAEIYRSGYTNQLAAGIVLTGGTTLMDGVAELAEAIFELPTRCAVPGGVGGLRDVVRSPQFSTGVGLVRYGAREARPTDFAYGKPQPGVVKRAWSRLTEIF